jgi:hypothetical protein
MARVRRRIIFALVTLAGACAILFMPLLTYREISSPNNEFTVIAKTAVFHALIPVMPGQAGDKPCRIVVVRKDGRSCGAAPVEMVSMITNMRWQLDRKPREVSLVATARWDLDACRVEVFDR